MNQQEHTMHIDFEPSAYGVLRRPGESRFAYAYRIAERDSATQSRPAWWGVWLSGAAVGFCIAIIIGAAKAESADHGIADRLEMPR